jgi:hypothetical protein
MLNTHAPEPLTDVPVTLYYWANADVWGLTAAPLAEGQHREFTLTPFDDPTSGRYLLDEVTP